ncbi:MAG: divalent-cation tolerance protein CutA [Sneathiellaceae bacterium]
MTAVLLYVTTDSVAEAEAIGRALVEARLAACANILPGMRSVFRWEGEVQTGAECVLILKTQPALAARATAAVVAAHSYDCPCVLQLPVQGGNPAFLDWIAAETAESGAGRG